MENSGLGRLEQVDVRTVWTNEASEFTPWLAQQENLEILGETLGLTLETESVEKEVGSFRADIVCKDTKKESVVLIENQLDRTDHTHLGQLLTYGAGLQAVTVIWLATQIKDEHRAALDWLNTITPDDFGFFGVEIELWKIGDSSVAPRFNIVSMPNDWSRSVASTTDNKSKSETKLKQLDYWDGLQGVLNDQSGAVSGNKKPQPQHWMSYPIGRTGFNLGASLNIAEGHVRVELYMAGEEARSHRAQLERQRDQIEQELDFELEWGDQTPNARDQRISYYLRDIDIEDKSDWHIQHKWIATNLNALHRVFVERIRNL